MPRRYALRQQSRVRREIETHLVRMIELTGEEIARDWYDQLINAIASLAQNPRRWPVIPEQSRFRYETRHLLYRRAPGGPLWRVLFTITGEESGAADAPTVMLLHIRHGAQKPLTRREAEQIGQGDE